jgi:hypothetical protein
VPGRGFVAGSSYPDYLQVSTRPYAPTPDAYRAGKEVELLPGFETATATDELLVEIQAGSGVLSNDYPGGEGNYESYGYYRYGFNGQEKSDEIKGSGNSYTAEFWEYDPRLGRRWNLDPVIKIGISDYSVFINNPIKYFDKNGDDTGRVFIPEKKWKNVYKTHMKGISKNPNLLNDNGHIYLDYDPLKSNARARRSKALKGTKNPTPQTHDVDEFPYASTKQGGSNAATNLVPRRENRQHGGYLGWVVTFYKMKDGDVFDIVLIPDISPEPKPQPVFVPLPAREIKPIGGYPGQGFGELISKGIEWLTGKKIPIPDPIPTPIPAPVRGLVPVPAIQ